MAIFRNGWLVHLRRRRWFAGWSAPEQIPFAAIEYCAWYAASL
jgi:hypothetical protein